MAWLTQAFNDIAAGKPLATVVEDAINGIKAGWASFVASNPAAQTLVNDATEAVTTIEIATSSYFSKEIAAGVSDVETAVTNLASSLKVSGNTTQAILQVLQDATPLLQAAITTGIASIQL